MIISITTESASHCSDHTLELVTDKFNENKACRNTVFLLYKSLFLLVQHQIDFIPLFFHSRHCHTSLTSHKRSFLILRTSNLASAKKKKKKKSY